MGGFIEAIGSLASKFGSYATEKLRDSDIGSLLHELLFNQHDEFKRTPEGQALGAKVFGYEQVRSQILNELTKPITEVKESIKNNPTLLKKSIGQLHSDFTSTNHPTAAYTGQILKNNPDASKLDIGGATAQVGMQARLLANKKVYGDNGSQIFNIIMPLYESEDPTMHSHADAMLSIIANQTHDTTKIKEGIYGSGTKLNMQKLAKLINQAREAGGEEPLGIDPEKIPVGNVFTKSNKIEQLASQRARIFLAPMIAINHMSTFFNYSNAPLAAIYKSLAESPDAEVKNILDASGIFGTQMHHMVADEIASRTGTIASKTGRPEVGNLVRQAFYNPGFNFIRKIQIQAGGILGYHSAIHWGEMITKGSKRAALELKEMGINPEEVMKNKGVLTREQLIKAVYNFTDNRAFLNRQLDRSLTATKNPWTRLLTMFHGYVSSQQAFMRRELQKMLDAGDHVGIARYAATVGLLFPAVAPMLKSAEVLARSASPSRAIGGAEEDYKKLAHPENTKQFLAEYLDMLSYFGSWGTLHSFLEASHSDRLALALMGPIAGSTIRTAQDAINAATKETKSGHHNLRPLAKDILQQTVPIGGNIASNQLFPPKDTNQ